MLAAEETKKRTRISRGSKQCPVGIDLATLGRKWAIHILRSIGVEHIDRFNRILRSLPGLTARVLIMRLNELEESGLITPVIIQERPKRVLDPHGERGRYASDTRRLLFLHDKMASRCNIEESS